MDYRNFSIQSRGVKTWGSVSLAWPDSHHELPTDSQNHDHGDSNHREPNRFNHGHNQPYGLSGNPSTITRSWLCPEANSITNAMLYHTSMAGPQVLNYPVDASQYEHVSYEDWAMADNGIEHSSPETTRMFNQPMARAANEVNSSAENCNTELDQSQIDTLCRYATLASNLDASFSSASHDSFMSCSSNLSGTISNYDSTPNGTDYATSPSSMAPTPRFESMDQITSSYENPASPEYTAIKTESDCDETPMETSADPEDYSKKRIPKRTASRQEQDKLLIKLRTKGMKYKDIKKRYGFTEAESTLRGRIRSLTKDKSERVRKPEWTKEDLILLRHGVNKSVAQRKRTPGRNLPKNRNSKLPWKMISQWMVEHGSSYAFAPATCAKKWIEIE